MHMLVILDPSYKIQTADQIDRIVCAEIPDPVKQPVEHALCTKTMLHNPCGPLNLKASCMVPSSKGDQAMVCSKHFPKEFSNETIVNKNGHTTYRRRSPDAGGFTAKIGPKDHEIILDNRNVVPYNPYLLKRYNAHINVEIVAAMHSVKYLYKYILKGPDSATLEIVATDKENESALNYDEIRQFVHTRYMTPPEGICICIYYHLC